MEGSGVQGTKEQPAVSRTELQRSQWKADNFVWFTAKHKAGIHAVRDTDNGYDALCGAELQRHITPHATEVKKQCHKCRKELERLSIEEFPDA